MDTEETAASRTTLGREPGAEVFPPAGGDGQAPLGFAYVPESAFPPCQLCPLAAGCPSAGMTFAPLRKQSRFEGSFRQRRSAVLKRLVASRRLDVAALDDREALDALVADGLAEVSGGVATLPG